jgi:hypothetical protein
MSNKRIDKFKEYLQAIQGNGDLYIDQNFVSVIQRELNGQEITADGIKNVMRKYNAQLYYEYIPTFLNHLHQKVIYFTPDEEKNLCLLFECISNKYSALFPGISFFNYNYVTYKLVEYIKHPDLHLLSIKIKDQDTLKDMDAKWKILCEDLEWLFISSED